MTYVSEVGAVEAEMHGFQDLFDLLASSTPAWHADALCREYPDVNFFPSKGGQAERAKAVCSRCLVTAECLAWATDQEAWLSGVWGGTTTTDRRKMRRRLRPAA